MTVPKVVTATPEEASQAFATLTLAFVQDPMNRWVLPDPVQYLKNLGQLARGLGGAAFAHGSADRLEDFSGVALWLPPGISPDEQLLGRLIESEVAEKQRAELHEIGAQMGKFHPEGPHWYLAYAGVDLNRQSQGLGSVLIKHGLQRCDRDGLPAYLESSNPRNVPFYERHGYEVIGEIQTGTTPTMFAMLRLPR